MCFSRNRVKMCRRKGSKLCIVLAIVLGVAAKPPPPPGAPWAPYASKPVYYRSVGAPSIPGIDTISVPYMPKSPMFPKFVDPKMMISKKTEFLSNLFGGLGPVDTSGTAGNAYSKLGAVEPESIQEKRGLFSSMMGPGGPGGLGGPVGPGGPMASMGSMGQMGPMGQMGAMGQMGPMGPMGPKGSKAAKGPMFSPFSKFGMMGPKFPFGGFGSPMGSSFAESADSFSRRRRSVDTEPTKESTKQMGPPPSYPGLAPIAEEPESQLLKLFGDYSKSDSAITFDEPKSTVHDKRGLFGAFMMPFAAPVPVSPFYNPMAPMAPMVNPMASMYNPMAAMNPMFNPLFSKYNVMPPNLPLGPTADSDSSVSSDTSSRRRRSVETMENVESPVPVGPESMDSKTPLLKLFAPGFMPGMYGPFGPFGPFGPMAGPMSGPMSGPMAGPMAGPGMVPSKKAAFLDALFKNLATTPSPTVTDVPIPKSTIVPPNFWLPSSVIPGPTEYSQKVSKFLDKLFSQLALNVSLNSTTPEDSNAATVKVARSVDDYTKISEAKDSIVDSILTELGAIKGNMVSTMNDLINYEKSVAFNPLVKKPFKNLATNLWPSPTVDATMPFQQRMALLGQVFDMLTAMQRNITVAAQEAMKVQMTTTEEPVQSNYFPAIEGFPSFPEPSSPVFNTSLLDAIRNKLSSITIPSPVGASSPGFGFVPPKFARNAPSSIWVSHPPNAAASKREVEDYPLFEDQYGNNQNPRGVKMEMHQGYQSMPPGAIETVQAGGNSVPGHQGGGINLHIQMPASNSRSPDFENDMQNYNPAKQWSEWGDYVRKQYEGNRHHHNHH